MGWTQHTIGTQNIRAMTIIQLLLGNMGMAGGGINALRGESNVQGSTDQGLLFNVLPGYLPTPTASRRRPPGLYREIHAQDQGTEERELVVQPGQVHHELPQGDLRRQGAQGQRLRLCLAAEARRRHERFLAHALRPDAQGKVRRVLCLGPEPGLFGRQCEQDPARRSQSSSGW